MRYYNVLILIVATFSLAACGLDSKVARFLSESESSGVIQQPLAWYTWSGRESISEDILLWRHTSSTQQRSHGQHDIFSLSWVEQALASGYQLVVFAYDDECESCVLLDRSLMSSPAQIPQGVVVLRAQDDVARDLYNMTVPDEVVYIDNQGKEYYRTATLRSVEEMMFYLEEDNNQ